MGIQIFSAAPTNGTVGSTTIQAWGAPFSAALAAAGLVKTADTGQINWATAVTPAISTIAGYEIWRLNDSLQSTAPIFMKIEYGTSNPAVNVQIAVTVGTGTDGAGNITGVIKGRLVLAAGNSSATACNTYVTSDGSGVYFTLFGGTGGSNNSIPINFLLERSRTSTGTPTATAVAFAYGNGGSTYVWNVYPLALLTGFTQWNASPVIVPASLNGGAPGISTSMATDASNAPAIPIVLYALGVPAWTCQLAIFVAPADQSTSMSIVVNGSSRTYRGIIALSSVGILTIASGAGMYHAAMWVS